MKNKPNSTSNLRAAKTKIMLTGLIIGFVFIFFAAYLTHKYIGKTEEQRLSSIKQTVQIARNAIEPILEKLRENEISEPKALEEVRTIVRQMTYKDTSGKNYVFMSSYEGVMLVQPFEPDKELTYVLDLKDFYGNHIIRKLIGKARSKDRAGYVSYFYAHPDTKKPEEKISYVIGIPELNCYIGTGKYMTDIRSAQKNYIIGIAILTFVLLGLIASLVFSALKEVEKQNILLNQENTALKLAKETLRKSEGKFKELFDSINDVVYTQDIEGHFISVNPAMAKLFKISVSDFIGKKPTDFMKSHSKKLFETQYLGTLKKHGHFEGISNYLTKNNEEIFIEYHSKLVNPPKGPSYISGTGRDVTERINADRARRLLENQLRQAQKMEAVGTLAGGIAHDFNNILAAIMGYSELALTKANKGEPSAQELERILNASERAKTLIQQILTFSRKAEFELKPVNINQVIENVTPILEGSIPKMIKVRYDLTKNPHLIGGDTNQIEQVLLNLAINAKDAMPEGGTITIATENIRLTESHDLNNFQISEGNYLLLKVSDTGVGINKDILNKIFDPFFTTKELGKGTGLGLSTVFGIVKGHQGHLTCDSKPDKGTVFNIYFPVLKLKSTIQEIKEKEHPTTNKGNETILFVDDEDAIREIGCKVLSGMGYKTFSVSSGEEALTIYKNPEISIDLTILDISMPGMGGHKCLQELLKIDSNAKVIIASGYSGKTQLKDTLSLGAKGYIAKPFKMTELLKIMRKILDQ